MDAVNDLPNRWNRFPEGPSYGECPQCGESVLVVRNATTGIFLSPDMLTWHSHIAGGYSKIPADDQILRCLADRTAFRNAYPMLRELNGSAEASEIEAHAVLDDICELVACGSPETALLLLHRVRHQVPALAAEWRSQCLAVLGNTREADLLRLVHLGSVVANLVADRSCPETATRSASMRATPSSQQALGHHALTVLYEQSGRAPSWHWVLSTVSTHALELLEQRIRAPRSEVVRLRELIIARGGCDLVLDWVKDAMAAGTPNLAIRYAQMSIDIDGNRLLPELVALGRSLNDPLLQFWMDLASDSTAWAQMRRLDKLRSQSESARYRWINPTPMYADRAVLEEIATANYHVGQRSAARAWLDVLIRNSDSIGPGLELALAFDDKDILPDLAASGRLATAQIIKYLKGQANSEAQALSMTLALDVLARVIDRCDDDGAFVGSLSQVHYQLASEQYRRLLKGLSRKSHHRLLALWADDAASHAVDLEPTDHETFQRVTLRELTQSIRRWAPGQDEMLLESSLRLGDKDAACRAVALLVYAHRRPSDVQRTVRTLYQAGYFAGARILIENQSNLPQPKPHLISMCYYAYASRDLSTVHSTLETFNIKHSPRLTNTLIHLAGQQQDRMGHEILKSRLEENEWKSIQAAKLHAWDTKKFVSYDDNAWPGPSTNLLNWARKHNRNQQSSSRPCKRRQSNRRLEYSPGTFRHSISYGVPTGTGDTRFGHRSAFEVGTAAYAASSDEFLGETTDDDHDWRGNDRYF